MKRLILSAWLLAGLLPVLAQDPGARQDAIEERQKLLKAADQIDLLLQQNTQLTQQLTDLRERLTKLETANADLKTKLEQLQKDREIDKEKLLKEVAKIVAAKPAGETAPAPTASTKSETGFEYIVQQGQSLWAIADAYQKAGVNVTVDDIRRANNLSSDTLQVGQKLFIPKK